MEDYYIVKHFVFQSVLELISYLFYLTILFLRYSRCIRRWSRMNDTLVFQMFVYYFNLYEFSDWVAVSHAIRTTIFV